jgi:hypothetical protein
MVAVCYDKAPPRWQEAVHAEVEVTSLPPRIRCEMVNRRTGETSSWDSGSASLAPFVLAVLAGSGALAAAWSGVRRTSLSPAHR